MYIVAVEDVTSSNGKSTHVIPHLSVLHLTLLALSLVLSVLEAFMIEDSGGGGYMTDNVAL